MLAILLQKHHKFTLKPVIYHHYCSKLSPKKIYTNTRACLRLEKCTFHNIFHLLNIFYPLNIFHTSTSVQEWLGGGWECYWSDSESSGPPLLRNHTKIFTGFGFLLPHKNSHGFDDASSVCPKVT